MSDTVIVALISGLVSLIINFGSRWLDARSGIAKDIKDIKHDVSELKEHDNMNGDMIYQVLDHLSTLNNNGGMKQALDAYNSFYRHTEK